MNIGGGLRTTLNELIAHLNEIRGERRKPEYQSGRVGDVRHSLASIERAREVLGYRPFISLSEGLAHTLAWYANAAAT
jgi:nucleoside-diphosphate-sugar epimerase